jgi:DNA repair exonuclease SbcCD ATPase subunit
VFDFFKQLADLAERDPSAVILLIVAFMVLTLFTGNVIGVLRERGKNKDKDISFNQQQAQMQPVIALVEQLKFSNRNSENAAIKYDQTVERYEKQFSRILDDREKDRQIEAERTRVEEARVGTRIKDLENRDRQIDALTQSFQGLSVFFKELPGIFATAVKQQNDFVNLEANRSVKTIIDATQLRQETANAAIKDVSTMVNDFQGETKATLNEIKQTVDEIKAEVGKAFAAETDQINQLGQRIAQQLEDVNKKLDAVQAEVNKSEAPDAAKPDEGAKP